MLIDRLIELKSKYPWLDFEKYPDELEKIIKTATCHISHIKLPIFCKKHNEKFYKRIDHLFDKHSNTFQGCKYCVKEHKNNISKHTIKELIDSWKIRIKDNITYEHTDLSIGKNWDRNTKIIVTCPKHGDFQIAIGVRTSGSGCKLCYKDRQHAGVCLLPERKIDTNMWLKRFQEVHGDRYDYSLITEIHNQNDKIPIICKKHGIFYQSPAKHYRERQNCPNCNEQSKGELAITNYLIKNKIDFEPEKKFPNLIGLGGFPLRYDFYIEKYNLLIEFDGIIHYQDRYNRPNIFQKQLEHDKIKTEYAQKNNYTLIRINHINKINETLNNFFHTIKIEKNINNVNMMNIDKEFIKNYFKEIKFSIASCRSFLKKFENINKAVEDILLSIPEYKTSYHVIEYILNDLELPKCLNCGSYIDADKHKILLRRGGNFYCRKCTQNADIKHEIFQKSLPKFKETMIKRYGVEFGGQSEELNKKKRDTCLKKYGVIYAQSSEQVINKRKETNKKKYGYDNITKLIKLKNLELFQQYLEPLFDVNEYITSVNDIEKNYKWKCKKCGNIFEDHIHKTLHIKEIPYLPRCLNCYPYHAGDSEEELELTEYIKSIYSGEILENDRTIIKPYELDIVIPEKKLAFEFNGSLWHSVEYSDSNKVLLKTELCEASGYQLIHIWEYDWLNKKDLIKAKIKAILGYYNRSIYARKCNIQEISIEDKNNFLNKHHIQGEDKSKIKLGLYYNSELVAVMTFGESRFNKKYEWELIRYASSEHVIGGAGKLLKYFERNYNPKNLITYADRCYSKGNMYLKLGFQLIDKSIPNYFYTNNEIFLSRYQCQKNKLKKILGDDKFDENLSESENMFKNRFMKIYDCGNLVFIKNYLN